MSEKEKAGSQLSFAEQMAERRKMMEERHRRHNEEQQKKDEEEEEEVEELKKTYYRPNGREVKRVVTMRDFDFEKINVVSPYCKPTSGVQGRGTRTVTQVKTMKDLHERKGSGGMYSEVDRLGKIQPIEGECYLDFAVRLVSHVRYQSSLNRIRAIYTWLHENIKYDLSSVKDGGKFRQNQGDLDRLFKTRKAVCVGLSRLFKAMVNRVSKEYDDGIEAKIVGGQSKIDFQCLLRDGKFSGHAWNSIMFNNRKYLFDVTQGGDDYFFIPEKNMRSVYMENKIDGLNIDEDGNNEEEEEGEKSEEMANVRLVEFSETPCFHPTYHARKWHLHTEYSPFFKGNHQNVSKLVEEDAKKKEVSKPPVEVVKKVFTWKDMLLKKEKEEGEQGSGASAALRKERLVMSIPDSGLAQSVQARIRWKNGLEWNPDIEDGKLDVANLWLDVKKKDGGKNGTAFLVNVPVTENRGRKYGLIQFFCNGVLVWEYCLIYK